MLAKGRKIINVPYRLFQKMYVGYYFGQISWRAFLRIFWGGPDFFSPFNALREMPLDVGDKKKYITHFLNQRFIICNSAEFVIVPYWNTPWDTRLLSFWSLPLPRNRTVVQAPE